MTENEAIKELKEDFHELGKAIPCDTGWGIAINQAYSMAIKALEEIQQYRAIGTVEEIQQKLKNMSLVIDTDRDLLNRYIAIGTIEEFKALKEKSAAKKTKSNKVIVSNDSYAYCPHCKNPVQIWNRSCEKCGGELDWQ